MTSFKDLSRERPPATPEPTGTRSERIAAQVRRQENPALAALAKEYFEELDRALGPDVRTVIDFSAARRARALRERLVSAGWDFKFQKLAERVTRNGGDGYGPNAA